jgi:hypothetical protein
MGMRRGGTRLRGRPLGSDHRIGLPRNARSDPSVTPSHSSRLAAGLAGEAQRAGAMRLQGRCGSLYGRLLSGRPIVEAGRSRLQARCWGRPQQNDARSLASPPAGHRWRLPPCAPGGESSRRGAYDSGVLSAPEGWLCRASGPSRIAHSVRGSGRPRP